MKYKLIVFDIDGTITRHISSWRYIHEELGLWDDIACRYQNKFLSGKISYRKFCELDAAHWKGIHEIKIKKIFKSALYAQNAVKCIKKLKKMGFKLAAVSTGLQYIADRIKKELGFDYVLSNRLVSKNGRLTGEVKINISHGGKGRIFKKIIKKFAVKPGEVICVGDSAGDIPMARLSGYSIAFNSSSDELSGLSDHSCGRKDFKEVFDRIAFISKTKNYQ
jgi:phosphoserine phosphatase